MGQAVVTGGSPRDIFVAFFLYGWVGEKEKSGQVFVWFSKRRE